MSHTIDNDSEKQNNPDESIATCYNQPMADDDKRKSPEYDRLLTDEELAIRIQRRKEGMKLHEIEGNPLDADQIATFEMFERERWSDEKCRDYILAQIAREKNAPKK